MSGRLRLFSRLGELPETAAALLGTVGRDHLFASAPWFETFIAAGLGAGAVPVFCVLEDSAARARAILAGQTLPAHSPDEPGFAALTSFYSCDFRPIVAPGANDEETAFDLGRAIADRFAGEAVIRLDSFDSGLPTLRPLLSGLARPGRALLRYDHFGRWWEDLGERDWDGYMAARDGALRETVRRKTARLNKAGATFEIVPDSEVERGVADYEAVYARSWKEPEPFPEFQPTLMRNLACAGWLRLAICRVGPRPIAAQLWAVSGGRATVLKLAHDTGFDRDSPGTALTAFAIRAILERDRPRFLDFGRGDDPYKRHWTSNRTPHVGVISASILRRPGLIARHLAGVARRRLRGPAEG